MNRGNKIYMLVQTRKKDVALFAKIGNYSTFELLQDIPFVYFSAILCDQRTYR